MDDPQVRLIEALDQIRDELRTSREEDQRRYDEYRKEYKDQQGRYIHYWYLWISIFIFALGVFAAFLIQGFFI